MLKVEADVNVLFPAIVWSCVFNMGDIQRADVAVSFTDMKA
ncbi:Uncharacterised protein [uncultured archaeon]|nr:Uncharacterised protein [uncultured archaeon]